MKANQVKGWFLRREETGVPGENLSVQSREPTNSTHIWRRVRESNPGHTGGRRVLSPLRHPCIRFTKKTPWFLFGDIYFTLHSRQVAPSSFQIYFQKKSQKTTNLPRLTICHKNLFLFVGFEGPILKSLEIMRFAISFWSAQTALSSLTVIFIILRNLTFKRNTPNCVLASVNQMSEHSREDRLRLRKVKWI